MNKAQPYPLGYSAQEAQRLTNQAARLEEFTQDVFQRAGLRRGMHVLDIGSGMGDVSLLAATIVGSEGSVLGVEKASSSVQAARLRVATLGVANVSFNECDLAAFETDMRFDAIVGRFVLSYVPERAVVLQRLARYLKPRAIIALLEIDMPQISQAPPSALFMQVRSWVLEAFAATGAELSMGTHLYPTFLHANLPAPNMIAAHPVVGGSTCSGYEELVQALRSLLPVIERNGITNSADIDIDTLVARLREDAAMNDRVLFMSRVVGAWVQLTDTASHNS